MQCRFCFVKYLLCAVVFQSVFFSVIEGLYLFSVAAPLVTISDGCVQCFSFFFIIGVILSFFFMVGAFSATALKVKSFLPLKLGLIAHCVCLVVFSIHHDVFGDVLNWT